MGTKMRESTGRDINIETYLRVILTRMLLVRLVTAKKIERF